MSILKSFNLAGRVALVTGSSRGIGRAIALGLAESGAAVAVHAHALCETLDLSLAEVRRLSPRSIAVVGDLAVEDAAPRIVNETIQALGSLDILVANASVQYRKRWEEITVQESREQLQVNLISTLQLIQAAVPGMRTRKWGRILTIGSVNQQRPHPDMAVYAASKSAQENLIRNLAKQLGRDRITVNNLAPGVILTDRSKPVLADQAYANKVRGLIPLRRFAEPEECVGAALLLCSDAGSYITGADILVDGGMRLP